MTNGNVKLMFTVDPISLEGTVDKQYELYPQGHNMCAIKKNEAYYCHPHRNLKPRVLSTGLNRYSCECDGDRQQTSNSLTKFNKKRRQRRYSLPTQKEPETSPKEDMIYYVLPAFRSTLVVDAHVSSCISNELAHSQTFRKRFLRFIRRNGGFRSCTSEYEEWTEEEQEMWEHYLKVPYLIDIVTVWPLQKIDYSWLYRIQSLLGKHVQLEEGFAWLSTLGGAHSALGEIFLKHAEKAGSISKQQLKLSILLGNTLMIARCYVFWAWSLMQRGDMASSKMCIRVVWWWCQNQYCKDKILENMCLAVWSRLKWKHSLLKAVRSTNPSCNPGGASGSDRDNSGDGPAISRKNGNCQQAAAKSQDSFNHCHGDSPPPITNVFSREAVNLNTNNSSLLVSLNSPTIDAGTVVR